jgi:hypothetical protein
LLFVISTTTRRLKERARRGGKNPKMLRNLFQQKIAHEGDVYYESWENREWFDAVIGAAVIGVVAYIGLLYAISSQPK